MILAPIALNPNLDPEAVRVLARQYADGDRNGDGTPDAKPINVVVPVPSNRAAAPWRSHAAHVWRAPGRARVGTRPAVRHPHRRPATALLRPGPAAAARRGRRRPGPAHAHPARHPAQRGHRAAARRRTTRRGAGPARPRQPPYHPGLPTRRPTGPQPPPTAPDAAWPPSWPYVSSRAAKGRTLALSVHRAVDWTDPGEAELVQRALTANGLLIAFGGAAGGCLPAPAQPMQLLRQRILLS